MGKKVVRDGAMEKGKFHIFFMLFLQFLLNGLTLRALSP